MTIRTQQFLATALFGAAVLTAFALVTPQILSPLPTPVVAEVTTAVEAIPIDVAVDEAVDMNHLQETRKPPPSPYKPGKPRKGK